MLKSNLIKTFSLFEELSDEQLSSLARTIKLKSCSKGELLFREGDKANALYLLFQGKVKIYKLSPEGKEQILKIASSNEIFAEVPLFEGGCFPANAEAIKKSEVGILSREALFHLIHDDSEIAMEMLAILSKRLRHLTSMIEGLTLKETAARFAAYLLDSSEQHGGVSTFELDISKTILANLLGTSRENLSRLSQKMVKQSLIGVDNKLITLLDKEKLQKIANGLAEII